MIATLVIRSHILPDSAYASQQYYTTIVQNAANEWNGITSSIGIQSESPSASSKIRSYVSVSEDTNYWGIALPSCANGFSVSSECVNTVRWTSVRIIGFTKNMDNDGFTTTNKLHTWIHEFGHALSMSHVTEPGVYATMRQGKLNYSVQGRDRQNLKTKWGG